jgi:tRNA pseudouridine65 synthase
MVAIDKPSGLVVHRSALAGDRQTCLSLLRGQLGRWVYPVHRLDRGTSGVLVFCLDPESARPLAEAFAAGLVKKSYLALVRGVLPESGVIDRPLAEEGRAALPALTRFRRLAQVELPRAVGRYPTSRYSLARVEPATGRWHQIRRHLEGISHPIVGDVTQGDGRHNRFFREEYGARRLQLHAERVRLPHPESGAPVCLEAPVPAEMVALFSALGWREEQWVPLPAAKGDAPHLAD